MLIVILLVIAVCVAIVFWKTRHIKALPSQVTQSVTSVEEVQTLEKEIKALTPETLKAKKPRKKYGTRVKKPSNLM